MAAVRKRNKDGVHEVALPLRESSASLVVTATRVFRERAETKQREFMGAAQTHVAKGAAMLSDAIEQKLEDVIDRCCWLRLYCLLLAVVQSEHLHKVEPE